eukprot:354734-Chlamydomonas_euryale.AAC.10
MASGNRLPQGISLSGGKRPLHPRHRSTSIPRLRTVACCCAQSCTVAYLYSCVMLRTGEGRDRCPSWVPPIISVPSQPFSHVSLPSNSNAWTAMIEVMMSDSIDTCLVAKAAETQSTTQSSQRCQDDQMSPQYPSVFRRSASTFVWNFISWGLVSAQKHVGQDAAVREIGHGTLPDRWAKP